MDLRLDNKTAIVCGSSQGIGKAVAIQLAEMGCNIILLARNKVKLEQTLSELPKTNNQKHKYFSVDFSEPANVILQITEYIESVKPIEILVNNAGGPIPGKAHEANIDSYIMAFRQHLIMSQLLVQEISPMMIKSGFGRIINIISVGAKQPIENLGVSNTIRGAMVSWSKTISRELGSYGITVNNILPGQTMTERLNSLIENISLNSGKSKDEVIKGMISEIPAGRFGKPEEIAYAVGFLASRQASFINGINLPVDGGFLKSL
jgi:3-oxoacyl-[acyl-carrier protein] reductase